MDDYEAIKSFTDHFPRCAVTKSNPHESVGLKADHPSDQTGELFGGYRGMH